MNSSGSTILLYCIAAAVALMAYATGQNWSFATESAIAFGIVHFLYHPLSAIAPVQASARLAALSY